jgi:peptidoglycan hydrolase-like protein with peptidoglycan-binding domain
MYDGINTDARAIAKLIKPGDLVAYYIDGRYAWGQDEISLFPYNTHVTITVLGNPADVADCETGDMTPQSAAEWIVRQRHNGYLRPTVYRSRSVMKDIREATGELVMGRDWDSWVADYDNNADPDYSGEVAKQYRSLLDHDVSAVYDDLWPHRHAIHPPIAAVESPKWPVGLILRLGNKGNAVEALQKACYGSGIRGVRGIEVDGIFGQQTQTAVRNFEAFEHLNVDSGIAGTQVRNAFIRIGALSSAGQATG